MLSPKPDHLEGTRLRSVQSCHPGLVALSPARTDLCCFPLAASVLLPHGDGKRQAIGDTSRVIDGS